MSDITPQVGQTWADRDPRSEGRTVEVLAVDEHFVEVRTKPRWARSQCRRSRIRLAQFRRRFRLVDARDCRTPGCRAPAVEHSDSGKSYCAACWQRVTTEGMP